MTKKKYKDMTPEEKFQARITWDDPNDIVILGKPQVIETVIDPNNIPHEATDEEPPAATYTTKRKK